MTCAPKVDVSLSPPERRVEIATPSGVPTFSVGLGLLALSGLLATPTAWGWGQGPNAGMPTRLLFAAGGFAGAMVAMLYGVELLRNGGDALLHPSCAAESVGPCRLIQLGPNRWELRLASPPISASGESDPCFAIGGKDLHFAIDEAHAAEMSRLFDPEEVLRIRWVDLPTALGGRTLLGIEEVQATSLSHLNHVASASDEVNLRHAA